MSNKNIAKQLMASSFPFKKAGKKVEKSWDTELWLIYIKWCKIAAEHLGNCKNRPEKCIICARKHPASEYSFGVNGYSKKSEK